MQVTADQTATIRAFLEGDFDRYRRLNAQRDPTASLALSALLNAAFYTAVRRRFPTGTKASDVISFVGDVRARYEGLTDSLDPHVAERLIRSTLTGEDDGLDSGEAIDAQLYLMYVLIADEQLDEAGLDAFLAEARALADEAIAED